MEPQLKPVPLQNAQNAQPGWASTGSGSTVTPAANSVLRNTYWLLALSMLPTIFGAYVGSSMDFAAFYRTSPIMAPLLMFGAMFGMLFVVSALRNSAWGIAAVFGFTFVSGIYGPLWELKLADGEGFEPTKGLRPCRISSPVHSTALPPIP